jgi:hypothetical protein
MKGFVYDKVLKKCVRLLGSLPLDSRAEGHEKLKDIKAMFLKGQRKNLCHIIVQDKKGCMLKIYAAQCKR